MKVRGRCAYTAQDAWIQNASLRDNVLMGQPWDRARYRAVVAACALQPDIELLAAGPLLRHYLRTSSVCLVRFGVTKHPCPAVWTIRTHHR